MKPLQQAYQGVVNGELPRVEGAVRAGLEDGVAARSCRQENTSLTCKRVT